jgi:hypothetical protein
MVRSAAPGERSELRGHRQQLAKSAALTPPCARSQISGWRDGVLYPLAGRRQARRRIMPELEATAPPIPFWFYRKATSNYVEMSRRGWLKAEPNGIAREQSSVLQDIINDLISQGITKTKISAELMVSPSEVEGLLFGLANITTIDGAGNPTPKRDVRLTLVK